MHTHIIDRRSFVAAAGTAALVAACALAGCGQGGTSAATTGSQASGSVTAVGSTALQPLVEAAAEQYMGKNPSVQITVQGGGSGQGITQIAQGAVQVGDSDVFAESKLPNKSDASKLTDNKVAVVGMGPVANKDVTIDNLTMDQLKGIFTGTITNWNQVGGPDEAITVINRASGSGTRATFEDAVLAGTPVPDSFKPQEQDSSGTVAKMVASTPGAISYLAFSYFDDSQFKSLSVDGVKPTKDNVTTNQWKIWAYEHMYTSTSPDAATQAFVDYMLGTDVQGSLVEKNGYIPVSSMKVSRDASGNVTV